MMLVIDKPKGLDADAQIESPFEILAPLLNIQGSLLLQDLLIHKHQLDGVRNYQFSFRNHLLLLIQVEVKSVVVNDSHLQHF